MDFNTVRKILKPYYNKNDAFLSWVTVNNQYTANIKIIKSKSAYLILLAVFREMLEQYADAERFYELCDTVHNIPLILADEKKPEKIIANRIKAYRKKYNSLFLKEELNYQFWKGLVFSWV